MSVAEAYNFRKVSGQVATAGLLTKQQLQALAADGYELVINLLPDSYDYAIADERQIVESQGVEYCYIPVDFDAPARSDYEQFKTAMAGVGERKLLIHCAANYRVSAFYSWYAVEQGIWSQEQANEFRESIWDLNSYPGWPELHDEINSGG